MPRFVILVHEAPWGRHWDLMLEKGPALATWAIPRPPDAAGTLLAEALPDHRLAYLDYEGPVSGGRGHVTRWDQGTYQVDQESETGLEVVLCGGKLAGRVRLCRCPGESRLWEYSFCAQDPRAEQLR